MVRLFSPLNTPEGREVRELECKLQSVGFERNKGSRKEWREQEKEAVKSIEYIR